MLSLDKAHQLNIRSSIASAESGGVAPERRAQLLEQAKKFEAVFVSQMLNYSGLTKAVSQNSSFGGEAFSSLLVQEYADKLVDSGGFGLAEKIYSQLLDKEA